MTRFAILLSGLLWPVLSFAAVAPERGPATPPPITLQVDLGRAPQRIIEVVERIPVTPGPLTLRYPQWLPGKHRPDGPVANVAGVMIRAGGKALDWRRDLHDMYSVHLNVPAGVAALDLSFQLLVPRHHDGYASGPSTSADLAALEFGQVLFYPADTPLAALRVRPSVTLPAGWSFASALVTAASDGRTVHFRPLSLAQLVDSPLLCGRHMHTVELGAAGAVPVRLNVAGDRGVDIRPDAAQTEALRAVQQQLSRLFGAAAYRHYDILLSLSDHIGYYGLGHRDSSDDRFPAGFFAKPEKFRLLAPLLVHEWIHAWNGSARRPASAWPVAFNAPRQTNLAWFQEGLTDYLAMVVSTRAGLWTPAYFRSALASTSQRMRHRSGRAWRSLQDTADAARLAWRGGHGWDNWRRRGDYHAEGVLLWLDVDTKIRALSDGDRSLDDFVRRFFAVPGDAGAVAPYDFDAIVVALRAVVPWDWAAFLRQRLDYTGAAFPYHGLARAGWPLGRGDSQGEYAGDLRALGYGIDLSGSVGLSVDEDGHVHDVQWRGPASAAGLVPGMTLVAVNHEAFSLDRLTQAIARAAADATADMVLLARDGDLYRTCRIDYHGGLRYARLVRSEGHPDRLSAITTALEP